MGTPMTLSNSLPGQNPGGPPFPAAANAVAAAANTPQGTRSTTPTASSANQNFSSLVSRILSTTGKDPPSLVGSSTTIIGDTLWVFGGRILSKLRPQLTSDMYKLDLLTRTWTKVEQFGEIPAPRYFHSVCALGDTKLVCFGGMSPAANAGPSGHDGSPAPNSASTQPDSSKDAANSNEVIVMSDINMFDIPTRTWSFIPQAEPPEGRYAHCATILPTSAVFSTLKGVAQAFDSGIIDGTGGAEMVIVGGQDSANHYIEEINVFNLRSLKWTSTSPLDRSCGAYRSVACPIGTSLSPAAIGAGREEAQNDGGKDKGRGIPAQETNAMLIYSNYNFLDVKLELQIRYPDGTLVEKPMNGHFSPPGLRFPNGGVIDSYFVVSGTYLTSSKQEYALWALDLRTLVWSRIDAGQVFSQGSWNRGILWKKRNRFLILGNKHRSLVEDYNHRRINFTHLCMVELEAFGYYENPMKSGAIPNRNVFSPQAQELGKLVLGMKDMADMEFISVDGASIPVNSRIVARRWGPYFLELLHAANPQNQNPQGAMIRPDSPSFLTTPPSPNMLPPLTRPRTLFLPHTHQTLLTLVHWLYTCSLPPPNHSQSSPQVLCSLLQLARPYRIEGLLEAVVERLHEVLDSRHSAAVFNAAAMAAGGGAALRLKKRALVLKNKADGDGHGSNSAQGANSDHAGADHIIRDPVKAEEFENEVGPDDEAWDGRGGVSAVVGLQKRGLRGLMEGRRLRERGRSVGGNAALSSGAAQTPVGGPSSANPRDARDPRDNSGQPPPTGTFGP